MELPEPDPNKGCLVGRSVAQRLGLSLGSALELSYGSNHAQLRVSGIVTAGGPDDNQVFVDLPVAQRLAGLGGRVSLVQLSVPGTPAAIEQFTNRVAAQLPGATVRPIRQLAEGEGRLFSRIKGLLLATVILILVLTALCVLATMAALAMDRRLDVGLMKALGGSMRQVLRLFLLEAGSLGLAGGLVGCGAGLLLSEWVGRRVFGAGVTPRLEVLPVTLALMVGVSLAGAFPLRLLARVKPAVIFRGEA
jgi:putative ABC transport system permease protein